MVDGAPQRGLVHVGQHELRAARSERARHGHADAAGAARDHRHATGERIHAPAYTAVRARHNRNPWVRLTANPRLAPVRAAASLPCSDGRPDARAWRRARPPTAGLGRATRCTSIDMRETAATAAPKGKRP